MMDSLLRELAVLGLKNRKVSILGNHTWASAAIKSMTEIIDSMKDMELVGKPLDIRSSLKSDREAELDALVDEIVASLEN